MEKIYDLIIIGAGPAGITASVYAARKRMDFLVLTSDVGGQAAWTADIENYTGYQFISGPDLVSKFEEHIKQYDVPVRRNEPAVGVVREKDLIVIKTEKGVYKTRSAIIASGKTSMELGVPGEKEFKNKGVTYCATCDGPLFPGKDVVVVGGGNSALEAAIQLVKIANKVYIVNITPDLGGDAIVREKVTAAENVTIMNDSEIAAVLGETFVSSVKVRKEGKKEEIPVQGVFVEIGLAPNAGFVDGIEKNERGELKVNCLNETSMPGVFAAGDVTDVPEKQIIIAAGDGAKAALGAFRFISRVSTKDWGKK